MLEGVLEVADLQVRDIMIPRAQMVFLRRDDPPLHAGILEQQLVAGDQHLVCARREQIPEVDSPPGAPRHRTQRDRMLGLCSVQGREGCLGSSVQHLEK